MAPTEVRPDIDSSENILTWLIAAVLAGAALLGVFIFVSLVVIALQPPGWIQTTLGVGMALGSAIFAWLIATALRSRARHDPPQLVARSGDPQTRRRRTA